MSRQASERTASPIDVFDLDDLRARAGHDEALVYDVLEDFLRCGVRTSELRCAAEARAFGELGKAAHRLRGTLLALGARTAGRIAGDVELRASALAKGTGLPDALSLALSLSLAELTVRFDEACDAMRAVLDRAGP